MVSDRFAGRRVLVTGGSSGIGRAVALAFAEAGARVVAAGRSEERLRELEATAPGDSVAALRADVSTAAGAREMVAAAIERLDGLDALVNNAGVSYTEPFLEATAVSSPGSGTTTRTPPRCLRSSRREAEHRYAREANGAPLAGLRRLRPRQQLGLPRLSGGGARRVA